MSIKVKTSDQLDAVNNNISFIESVIKEYNEKLYKLKVEKAELIAKQDYETYKKWNIDNNSFYIRILNDNNYILCEGYQVIEDDPKNSRFYSNMFKYRCCDDEYSLLAEKSCITYNSITQLTKEGSIYKVTDEYYVGVLMMLSEIPDRSNFVSKIKNPLENYFEKIQ